MRNIVRKLAWPVAMAMATTPALAEGDSLFVVENTSDAMIYTACGPVASVAAGQQSDILVCEWGTLNLMGHFQDGTGESRSEHTHRCPTPENPVHRVRVAETSNTAVDENGMQVPVLAFNDSCEAQQ